MRVRIAQLFPYRLLHLSRHPLGRPKGLVTIDSAAVATLGSPQLLK